MKKNYIIPYGERTTRIGKHNNFYTLMCVDNIGLIVYHEKDYKPTVKDVRRHLIGYNDQKKILIQANSIQDALQEFQNLPECKIGIKHKAWELVDSKENPIIEYSGCKWLLNRGWFSCQRYAEDGEIDNMVCVVDGLDDPPCDCLINAQLQEMGWRKEILEIGGVWVQSYNKNVMEMGEQTNGIIFKKINL